MGAPHLEQKDRSATSDSFKNTRVDSSVKVSAVFGTPVKGI